MKRLVIGSTLFLVLMGVSLVWAAPAQVPSDKDPKIGTRVTITGCLHEGTSAGSFVLVGVTERPADSTAAIQPLPFAIYWLDSNEGLKDRVGEMVDITGTVTERRSKPGRIMVSIDVSEVRSTDVRVQSGNKDLDVTTRKYDDRPRPVGTSGDDSTIAVTRPVYKLDVESVRHAANFPLSGPVCR